MRRLATADLLTGCEEVGYMILYESERPQAKAKRA